MSRRLNLQVAHARALKVADGHATRVANPFLPESVRNRASAYMHRAYLRAYRLQRAAARAWYVDVKGAR